MNGHKLTPIEWFVFATVVATILVLFLFGKVNCQTPTDYQYNPATDTATWTDESGRKMLRSPDGSVRELSR